jgi:hypothetical protein
MLEIQVYLAFLLTLVLQVLLAILVTLAQARYRLYTATSFHTFISLVITNLQCTTTLV